ncbi:MAG: TetR/AcrR family transcriptional regulator [Deltaproteobacteria bacterium]|nr:TetR/AcrR family transcriptional regulator [Deltaproteobacteria bacterium]
MMKTTETTRRRPKQARARATVDAILEGAKQALNQYGFVRATTHRIARIAGVSVGTLYQYYPDKQAVFGDLFDYLSNALHDGLAEIAEAENPTVAGIEDIATTVVRAYVAALKINRDALTPLLVKRTDIEGPEKREARHRQLHAWMMGLLDEHANLSIDHDYAAFVLLKTVDGVALSTIDERPEALDDGRLESELERLVTSYLRSAWEERGAQPREPKIASTAHQAAGTSPESTSPANLASTECAECADGAEVN